ncbi:VWA domain-containing protein [Pedosphaera parvula]|uniref:VWA domain-containing protein n=1 Tax=Pedosphaera parvula TaxID=1032527 RepID=UPI00192CAE5A|nr:VWA domain-containing protein [Pedosphaera parvula]
MIAFFWWAWRKRQQLMTQFTSARLLGHLKVGVSPSRQKFRMALVVAAVVFLILTLARPQWGFTLEEARQRGLDILVAIDTSNSMLAEDIQPNRLARARLAALDLMHRARTDRMGLVAFAGTAFLQCPLTLDDAAFSQSIDSLDTRTISEGGTALAEAINTARETFKNEKDNHKVLVLFTDGEDQDMGAVSAAEKAAAEGMLIFTIGIGTPDGELLRIKDERGRVDYIRDEQGQPVKSRLNEKLLQEIAEATKGFYLPLRGTKTMDMLYEQGIAPLPKSDKASTLLKRFHERYHWPLSIAIILLIAETFLPDRKRTRPEESRMRSQTSSAMPTSTVAILLLLALPLSTFASPSQAFREYQAGKYQDALKDYENSLQRKSNDPRLHFNAGTAAYQTQQYDEATKQFNDTLNSQDIQLQQQAYYNLGNTYFRLGQSDKDEKKKQEAWENALKHYESALKLNQQDQDAQFNHQFVQTQLEELKKKQQQQQQNQSKDQSKQNSKDQNQKNQESQDKQDQQNQEKDSQSKSDQQTQNKSQQGKNGQEKKDQGQESNKQDQEKSQSQAKNQKEQSEKKDQAAQNQAAQSKEKSEEEQREAAMMAAGQMTPQQAKQLLDSQKGEEEVLRLGPSSEKQLGRNRSLKNW